MTNRVRFEIFKRDQFQVAEAAKILGISRGLAYSLTRTGKLPAIRLGNRILVSRRAIEQLLDSAVGKKIKFTSGEKNRLDSSSSSR